MELKETIGMINYIRECDREFYEENQITEIRNLLAEILYELKVLNADRKDVCEDPEEDLPF